MCGVWALLGAQAPAEVVDACLKALHKRGPDASRTLVLSGKDVGKPQHRPFTFGFTRLAINGLTDAGMQPFSFTVPEEQVSAAEPGVTPLGTVPFPEPAPTPGTPRTPRTWAICNGEIYNYKEVAARHGIALTPGSSDCQPLPALYESCGGNASSLARCLDGVFALVLVDEGRGRVVAVRDPFGVRPLFVAQLQGGGVAFASEVKGLIPLPGVVSITPLTPGTARAWDLVTGAEIGQDTVEGKEAGVGTWFQPHWLKNPAYGPSPSGRIAARAALRVSLDCAVRKRLLVSDVPVGCLLSGGLDSSLVAALAQRAAIAAGRHPSALHTFSIGMAGSSDLAHARLVARHIGSTHHEVVLTPAQFLAAIPEVVHAIESFDITTVRASVGNYLVSRYIRANTDVRVVLNGDGSDEASGSYLYFYNAPNDEAFEGEVDRLLRDIHLFDVLRSDRSVSSNGLEPRTPFLDRQFVSTYTSIATTHRRPVRAAVLDHATGAIRPPAAEKQLLREAFDPSYTASDVAVVGEEGACPGGEVHLMQGEERRVVEENLKAGALSTGFPSTLLPSCVLWRRKEAFSDGVSSPDKSWYEVVQEHAEGVFKGGEAQWREQAAQYPPGPTCPYTAESVWYRSLFESQYGRLASSTIPYYWLPRWSGGARDPSARTLEVYSGTGEGKGGVVGTASSASPLSDPTGVVSGACSSASSPAWLGAVGMAGQGEITPPQEEEPAGEELWRKVAEVDGC